MSDPTEVIAESISQRQGVPASWRIEDARKALAALRADGWELYRSKDVEALLSMADLLVFEVGYFDDHNPEEWAIVRAAEYTANAIDRLVPVSEGTTSE